MCQSIRTAFAPRHAVLVAQGEAQIRGIFERAVATLGPGLRGVYNHPNFARIWSGVIQFVLKTENDVRVIDDAKLASYLDEWATSELESAILKLESKLQTLQEVVVTGFATGNSCFTVRGKNASGAFVRVEQDQIINVSSKGKLFNQWPARIYVNGKAVSEAAFKKMGEVV